MATAERDGDIILVETKWTEKELVKGLPGSRWAPDLKSWTMPLTWAACLQLRGAFTNLVIGEQLKAWSWEEFKTRVEPASVLRTQITRVNGDDSGFVYDKNLYDFQTAGAEFLDVAVSGLLGDDLGMGKTAQVYATIQKLIETGRAPLPALVICPNSVKTGWEKQKIKWSIDVHPYILHGGAAARRKLLEQAKSDPRALVIINIEGVRLLSRLAPYGSVRLARCRECDKAHGEDTLTPARCEVHPKPLNGFGFQTVILDEAHRIKTPSSKQTRAVWSVAHDDTVTRRIALTGTPIANDVGDLWSIMHFIEPAEYPTRGKFIDRYALQSWNAFGGLDIVGVNPATKNEFYKILDARFRRTPKALVLTQLPKVVRTQRWIDMVPKQQKAYEEMANRLITRLDNGDILVAPNNLVNATRLLQLSSSYCEVEYLTDPTDEDPYHTKAIVTPSEPSPKLDAMMAEYEALGGKPVVIAAMHRKLIDLAAKRFHDLKIPYGRITGLENEYERQRAIARFQAGQIPVILMTMDAGGTGVDGLQHADTMFVLQRSWSMLTNIQVDGRVDRIGSEVHDSVTIVEFITEGSIEETVQYPRLAEKYERLEEINRDRARLITEGADSAKLQELDLQQAKIMSSGLGTPIDYVHEFDDTARETGFIDATGRSINL
jgi:SNF2 family DNA or RNA helicase